MQLPEDSASHLPVSLKSLDVSLAQWEELPPWIARLTGLHSLSIGCNAVLKDLPLWLADLPDLRELHMNHTRGLSPAVPEVLGRLTRLTYLDLAYSAVRFEMIPDSLTALPHLTINA